MALKLPPVLTWASTESWTAASLPTGLPDRVEHGAHAYLVALGHAASRWPWDTTPHGGLSPFFMTIKCKAAQMHRDILQVLGTQGHWTLLFCPQQPYLWVLGPLSKLSVLLWCWAPPQLWL